MATPMQFPEANCLWQGPGDTGSLPAHQQDGVSVSCWSVSDAEVEEIRRTGQVWLYVWGEHPGVSITGICPYEKEESNP